MLVYKLIDFFSNFYLSIKVIHVISIICWMAGIFYLPRLFVYHADVSPQSESAKIFQVMEKRLFYAIMLPASILSLASGAILATITYVWSSGWMHLKLFSVLVLVCYQMLLNHWRLLLAKGRCQKSSRFFRLINEIPTVLLVIIIISVIVKPF